MAEQITIASFTKTGRKFQLTFADGSMAEWTDQTYLEQYIDNGSNMPDDQLVRGLLRRIRNSDPNFENIDLIADVTYEQPDVRQVP